MISICPAQRIKEAKMFRHQPEPSMSKVNFKHWWCALQLGMLAHVKICALEKCLRLVLKDSDSHRKNCPFFQQNPLGYTLLRVLPRQFKGSSIFSLLLSWIQWSAECTLLGILLSLPLSNCSEQNCPGQSYLHHPSSVLTAPTFFTEWWSPLHFLFRPIPTNMVISHCR